MFLRIALILALLLPLSGCIITPRIDISEQLDFDYVPQQPPMSYSDLLCCYDCQA